MAAPFGLLYSSLMKFAWLGFILVLSSCGTKDGYAPSTQSLLPSNPALLLDASVSGYSSTCGSLWPDLSGNSFHGTHSGCAAGTSGWRGSNTPSDPNRLLFDGTNYISTSLDQQQSTVAHTTWMAWILPTNLPVGGANRMVFGIDNNGGAFNRSLVINNGGSTFASYTGAANWASSLTATADVWQFVAVKFTPSDIVVYKNSSSSARGSAPSYGATALRFTIGRSNGGAGGEAFIGSMAWVAVYNRELSDSDIAKACHATKDRFLGATCQ